MKLGTKRRENSSTAKPSGKLKPRWECNEVRLVAKLGNRADWYIALETVAKELYIMDYQFQEAEPIQAHQVDSIPVIHLVQDKNTLTPRALPAGETGAWNGERSFKQAS
jgi:hypothetical protein